MLVVTGMFENERLIADRPVSIPQKKKVVVTIEEEYPPETKPEMTWREISKAIITCDEEIPGNPQPVQFRSVSEMEAL